MQRIIWCYSTFSSRFGFDILDLLAEYLQRKLLLLKSKLCHTLYYTFSFEKVSNYIFFLHLKSYF